MSLFFVFYKDVTQGDHPFNPVHASSRYSFKRYLKGNCDFYTQSTQYPLVINESSNGWELLKRNKQYCFICCKIRKDKFVLTLHSNQFADPVTREFTEAELRLDDQVASLIELHTSGKLTTEDEDNLIRLKEIQQAIDKETAPLTEEQVYSLTEAKKYTSFKQALSLVNSVFPGEEFKNLRSIRRFCTTKINQNAELIEALDASH